MAIANPLPYANGTGNLRVGVVLSGLLHYCEGIPVGRQPAEYASDVLKDILEQYGQSSRGVLEHRVLTAEVSDALDHGAAIGRHDRVPEILRGYVEQLGIELSGQRIPPAHVISQAQRNNGGVYHGQ